MTTSRDEIERLVLDYGIAAYADGNNGDAVDRKIEAVMSAIDRVLAEVENRDIDWVFAISKALGLESGFQVPVVPEVEPFKELFAAIRAERDARIAAQAKTVETLENMLFRAGSMDEPPCFLCGYNGEGYFQPDKHPCAAKHHAAIDAARSEGEKHD